MLKLSGYNILSSSRWLENFGRIRWNMKILHHPKNKHVHVTTYFWPNITTGREEKICTSAIPHISEEPQECGKLSGVQIFLVQVTGSLFFTKSALGWDPYCKAIIIRKLDQAALMTIELIPCNIYYWLHGNQINRFFPRVTRAH